MPELLVALTDYRQRFTALAQGYDGDLVVWWPESRFTVDAGLLRHRHKSTPYLGRTLDGVVERSFVRGNEVYRRGAPSDRPYGEILTRSAS